MDRRKTHIECCLSQPRRRGPDRRSKGWSCPACRSLVQTHRRGAAGPAPVPPYSQTCSSQDSATQLQSSAFVCLGSWANRRKVCTNSAYWDSESLNALPGPGVPCLSYPLISCPALLNSCVWTKCRLPSSVCLISAAILLQLFSDHLLSYLLCLHWCNWSQLPSHQLSGPLTPTICMLSEHRGKGAGPGEREGPGVWLGVYLISDWTRNKLSLPHDFSSSSTGRFTFHNLRDENKQPPLLPHFNHPFLTFSFPIYFLFVLTQQGTLVSL